MSHSRIGIARGRDSISIDLMTAAEGMDHVRKVLSSSPRRARDIDSFVRWSRFVTGSKITGTWAALNVYLRQYFDPFKGKAKYYIKVPEPFKKTAQGIALHSRPSHPREFCESRCVLQRSLVFSEMKLQHNTKLTVAENKDMCPVLSFHALRTCPSSRAKNLLPYARVAIPPGMVVSLPVGSQCFLRPQ